MSLAFFAHVFRVPTNRNETNESHPRNVRNERKNIPLFTNRIRSFREESIWNENGILFLIFSSSKSGAIQFCRERLPVCFETKRRSATRAPAIGLRAIQHGPSVSDAIISIALRYSVHSDFYQTIAQCTVHRSIVVSLSNNMLVAETRDATRVTQQCTS